MMNTPGTRQHTLLRTFRLCTFRSVGAAALFGSLVLACSGSYSTQETVDDDPGAPAATNTPAATAPAATTSSTTRPAAATPAATPAAATSTATPPAAAAATPPAAAAAATPPAAAADAPAAAADTVSFAADVWPILNSDCGPCHVDGNAGGHNAGSTDKALALKDAIRVDTGIVSEIQSGGMPLGCGKPPGGGGSCVSTEDFATIQEWVKAGTPP